MIATSICSVVLSVVSEDATLAPDVGEAVLAGVAR
jgi:hypothetical protein